MKDRATFPTIMYADTSSWDECQREYRFGAFFIFPPAGVIEEVDALRSTYDPQSASYCQAHISLSRPLPRPLNAEDLAEIRDRLAEIAPFDVHYGPLRSFPPYPGVTYSITPEDRFMALRAALHAASVFDRTSWRREQVAPHMTIAEFITSERTTELSEELRGQVREGAFFCNAIEYAVPNSTFYFEHALTIPLGQPTKLTHSPLRKHEPAR